MSPRKHRSSNRLEQCCHSTSARTIELGNFGGRGSKEEWCEKWRIFSDIAHAEINTIFSKSHYSPMRVLPNKLLNYDSKVKSSSLAYNRCETQDKRRLGKDPHRNLCHRHTRSFVARSPWMHGLSGSKLVCCHRSP